MAMNRNKLRETLLEMVPADGSAIGNTRLRESIGERLKRAVKEAEYVQVRDELVDEGMLVKGQGRGGSVRLAQPGDADEGDVDENAPSLVLQSPEAKPAAANKASKKRGAAKTAESRGKSKADDAEVLSYRHGDRRKNNPEVGMVDPDTDPAQPKTKWAYDPHIDPALQFDVGRAQVEKLIDDALASGDQDVMRRALEQLKRQAEPYLNWTGKAERTSFEVDTVSLHVHERIDPRAS